jgi:2'-5' RNA ligase
MRLVDEHRTIQSIRCFVAIEIPEAVQEQLLQVQNALRKHIQRASWVKPGNIHLTLKFLGDVNPDDIGGVGEAIKSVAARHRPFSLVFGGVGAFPSLSRPRAVWVGVKSGRDNAAALARDIEQALSPLGFSPENKAFNAHLTLARLKEQVDLRPFANVCRQYDTIDNATAAVKEISLIRSELHPRGSIYTTLHAYPLASP